MTNKINGIDVSKCKLYDYGICDSEMAENLNCEQNPDCYFKQLKRLEEECKLLHEAQEQGVEDEEELERLQEENKKIRQNWRLDCLKCEYKNTKADVDKYKQALEEIRDTTTHLDCLPENYTLKKYILEKIDEVLNDK